MQDFSLNKLSLNKTALNGEKTSLDTYFRFLPSLELKRDQLLVERGKAARRSADRCAALNALLAAVGEELPMLANRGVDLVGLVEVCAVRLGQERLLGIDLPVLEQIDVRVAKVACLGTPHWVDALAARLQTAMELSIGRQVDDERLARLERALKKVNQRINLFDKVLIPQTRQNVKVIQIALADADRAAVVRAKLAKHKRAVQTP
ncbi:MAG: V-type ATP synthase subunit D [Methylomonas sp.]|nr:V-type ATP synthase subunit D [Methylomonas sp.]PPD22765.1 MAG: V-type ATP synthase subunit D [Methylomonas sp.]PPD26750.1 MAG: V-type ATP synthase subunit D [Methylomonas sp.]PPD38586.1 MAG: V-type ATP synthase subunit D [Methylomonas sp.]PPD42795.1 MAG: V-type ATP synthase subunit D [Methylomonas sp.]